MVSAVFGARCYSGRMAKYKIVPDGLSGFGVEVTSANHHQSVRGFPTETDALQWIAEHRAATATTSAETGIPGASAPVENSASSRWR